MAFASNSGPLTCRTIREDCLWIEEGKRAICVTYKYDVHTGAIKYAASVFRRRISIHPRCASSGTKRATIMKSRATVSRTSSTMGSSRDLDGVDVENHHDTTTRRYQIRPAKVMGEPYMSYDDLIKTVGGRCATALGAADSQGSQVQERSFRVSGVAMF